MTEAKVTKSNPRGQGEPLISVFEFVRVEAGNFVPDELRYAG